MAEKERLAVTAIESYGVRLRVSSRRTALVQEIEERIKSFLPEGFFVKIHGGRVAHRFSVREGRAGRFILYKGRRKVTAGDDREIFLKYLDSQIRLTIAEYAVQRVFLHAGVVGWKGRGIIVPARSFAGKTTLVRELTKLGAKYYSDEYAVLDADGFVHPFPKPLSIRGLEDEYRQIDVPVEKLGGEKGVGPLPVGVILLTEYEAGARWEPQILNLGEGLLELISHTIPIRYNPKFSLKVLNNTANRAIIVKTKRGDAGEFAAKLLSFFEKEVPGGSVAIYKN